MSFGVAHRCASPNGCQYALVVEGVEPDQPCPATWTGGDWVGQGPTSEPAVAQTAVAAPAGWAQRTAPVRVCLSGLDGGFVVGAVEQHIVDVLVAPGQSASNRVEPTWSATVPEPAPPTHGDTAMPPPGLFSVPANPGVVCASRRSVRPSGPVSACGGCLRTMASCPVAASTTVVAHLSPTEARRAAQRALRVRAPHARRARGACLHRSSRRVRCSLAWPGHRASVEATLDPATARVRATVISIRRIRR